MIPTIDDARRQLAAVCAEPIEAAVLCHKDPEAKKLFGKKPVGPKLRINNWLVLTPTTLRIFALGGRTGMKLKDELGLWRRDAVHIDVDEVDRSSYFASTGSSLDYRVFRLRIVSPDTDFCTDVRMAPGLFDDDLALIEDDAIAEETDPEVVEGLTGLRETADEVRRMVHLIAHGCAGGATPTTR